MKQNLAVILRGQMREWKNAKFNFFKSMEQFEEHYNIVYFFVTWDHNYFTTIANQVTSIKIHQMRKVSNIDLFDIRNDFSGKNLGHLKILSYSDVNRFMKNFKLAEEYHLISYVRYIAGLIKQNYEIENDIFFDKVIETRPDVFIVPHGKPFDEITEVLPNFTYHAKTDIFARVENLTDEHRADFNTLFIDDLVFVSNGLTSDILTSEFAFLFSSSFDKIQLRMFPHTMLADFLLNFKLINRRNLIIYFRDVQILRPLEYFDKPVNLISTSDSTLDAVKKADQNFKFQKENLK